MSNSNSNRHHYIPKFHIKNFADEDGLIYVYDKGSKRMAKTKQSTKSIFFELNRNTIETNGMELNNLEELYAEFDNEISVHIQNIIKNKSVTPEECASVSVLASLLKWRVPSIDEEFNSIKSDLTIDDLKMKITSKGSKLPADAISAIEASQLFNETKRVLLSILPFLNPEKLLDLYENSFLHINDNYTSIIGDLPIIEKTQLASQDLQYTIFPISSKMTFIYHPSKNRRVKNILFDIQKDLVIFHLSQKYIACKSKEHLMKVVEAYNLIEREKKLDHLTKYIFDFID